MAFIVNAPVDFLLHFLVVLFVCCSHQTRFSFCIVFFRNENCWCACTLYAHIVCIVYHWLKPHIHNFCCIAQHNCQVRTVFFAFYIKLNSDGARVASIRFARLEFKITISVNVLSFAHLKILSWQIISLKMRKKTNFFSTNLKFHRESTGVKKNRGWEVEATIVRCMVINFHTVT